MRRPPRPVFDIAICDEFSGFDIAICDLKTIELLAGKLEHEIGRKSIPISFDRFVETKRRNSVDFCQVAIQHDPHTAYRADHLVNLLY